MQNRGFGLRSQPFPIYTTLHSSCSPDLEAICQIGQDEFDGLGATVGTQANGELKYLSDVQIAFLKGDLSSLFKNCPECADLYGGVQNALYLLNQMNIINVL
jgi:hypothetical protein